MKITKDILRSENIHDLTDRMTAIVELRINDGHDLVFSQILSDSRFVVAVMIWRHL